MAIEGHYHSMKENTHPNIRLKRTNAEFGNWVSSSHSLLENSGENGSVEERRKPRVPSNKRKAKDVCYVRFWM